MFSWIKKVTIFKSLIFYIFLLCFKKDHEIEGKDKRNWVFATNSNFQIPISLHPDSVKRLYFKLRLFELTEFIV